MTRKSGTGRVAGSCHIGRPLRPTARKGWWKPVGTDRRPPSLPISSAFSRAVGRFRGGTGPDFVFDLLTGLGVDLFPVVERALQYRAAHAVEQAADDLIDELVALGLVPDLADQSAGLAEVVVFRMQGVGAAHHLAVRLPAVGYRAGFIGPGADWPAVDGSWYRCGCAGRRCKRTRDQAASCPATGRSRARYCPARMPPVRSARRSFPDCGSGSSCRP